MDVQQTYAQWADIYDDNKNRTRDLEARVLRGLLALHNFRHCLEIGCGTGKNTVWLAEHAHAVTAADLSPEMLEKARQKVHSSRVEFVQADILKPWGFRRGHYDLAVFSLVLEHIEDLNPIFEHVADCLVPGGLVYVSELHPFKQYSGSQARFETQAGIQLVPCFLHHVSDFVKAAEGAGLFLHTLEEHFDEGDRSQIPRLITFLWEKHAKK
jgi:SAM-dependent methyltransferase